MVAALLPFQNSGVGAANGDGLFPWQLDPALPAGVAPIGVGFEVGLADLDFILDQIELAEYHMGPSFDANDPCGNIIGDDDPRQIPIGINSEVVPHGLRTLNGICNNLVPGQETFGSTDEPFIRMTTPEWRAAEPSGNPFGPGPVLPTTYDPALPNPYEIVADSEPRIISNLIVDQTRTNPAAIAAAGPDAPELCPPAQPGDPCIDFGETFNIENVAPDEGLSAPFNSMFTFFGQFFDHGLDLTTKSGETVFMPLQADDPLVLSGQVPPGLEFMVMSRAQIVGGDDPVNQTSLFVDQNQTYTSHPSQQVFQREYSFAAPLAPPVDTGRLLVSNPGPDEGMGTWADVKAQALLMGFMLNDEDVLNVPLMAADFYGNFLPGGSGFPQMVFPGLDMLPGTLDDVLVEGNPAAPVSSRGLDGLDGGGDDAVSAGRAWLADIAHHAVPGGGKTADTDETCNPGLPGSQLSPFCDDDDPGTYDNEMLDAHFICGDGRCNENIALSSVHHVFHSEHNRLQEQIIDTLSDVGVDPAFLAEWQTSPGVWDGKRLFQAAKFATEMQYQHLAFEEFARKIQPLVNEFIGYDTSIDSRITAEFAHSVYRFGHSMLTEQVGRFDTDTGVDQSLGLIEAFLNPPEFYAATAGGPAVKLPDAAAGGILAGAVATTGQHIDEFVVDALRNQLLGLPLDLATINLARGRDAGIPRLNAVRAQIFALTNSNPIFAPYSSWFTFGLGLETPESLVNYIAAYGTDPSVTGNSGACGAAGSMSCRREAATALLGDADFMNSTGPWAGVNTGIDDIDLWVGGLAEKKEIFGGLLGSTMNFFFELQMENLQDGDRFYYLHRLSGVPMLVSLEGNSFAELIERNTTAEQLPADVFSRPTYTFDLEVVANTQCGGIIDDTDPSIIPALANPTPWDESALLIEMPAPDCTIRYTDAEHALFSGRTTADDQIHSGDGDDTVRGHGGNDRLEGGGGNDGIIGGEGDDIITDTFGDDGLKGGPGNDAIHGGPGFDLIQGGADKDFMVIGSDPGEILAGSGDDFLLGGNSFDVLFGDEGDDWLEGGPQADLLQGDLGQLVENNPLNIDGHDVLNGNGGTDDYLGEGGDDIFFNSPGTNGFDGTLGYDWGINQGNNQPAMLDLERFEFLPPDLGPFESRFDLVEALSGWDGDDVLKGHGDLPDLFIVGDNGLNQAGIDRIDGLAALLQGQTSYNGNILLGGGGSDSIEGRGLEDLIDGDAWLRVQLCVASGGTPTDRVCLPGDARHNSMTTVQADVFAGTVSPGDLVIVREIVPGSPGTDIDTAVYGGPFADYDITENLDGSVTVVHARGLGGGGGGGGGNCPDINNPCDDGTDVLWNIERLAFSDQIVAAPCDTCLLRVTTEALVLGGGLPSQVIVDGSPRDRWGLNWMKVAPGAHEVCFSDLEGWVTPACETVVAAPGGTATVNGQFAQKGHIQVTTSPAVASTITVDGVRSNDWAVWTDVTVGPHEVCFSAVPDMTVTQQCTTVNVSAGVTTPLVGTFTSTPGTLGEGGPMGLLRITTEAGAGGGGVGSQVSVDGVDLDRWALNWLKLTPGDYTVCFSDVPDLTTPDCTSETVLAGQVTVASGVFEPRAIVQITTSPPKPSTITANGLPLNDWGFFADIPAGPTTVCFGVAEGFEPPCQVINLAPGPNPVVTGTWLP